MNGHGDRYEAVSYLNNSADLSPGTMAGLDVAGS